MLIRLQKFLADSGVASRRKSEILIKSGKILVNGCLVTELGCKVDIEKDKVEYLGKEVKLVKKHIYIMLNKPEGYITTVKDQYNRPSVLDLIKERNERLVPVGRLDCNTSGLLLLTNDGEMVFKLTHPSNKIDKTYIALVAGTPTQMQLAKLSKGVVLEGYKTAPAKISLVKKNGNNAFVKISIHEGKNRQVRKMFKAIGHPILNLQRVSIGEICLGELKKGGYRLLTKKELVSIKSLYTIHKRGNID